MAGPGQAEGTDESHHNILNGQCWTGKWRTYPDSASASWSRRLIFFVWT